MALLNFPIGTIIIWENLAIPSGWQVCNGTNGTPDLVGKFVQGASVDGDVGGIGGISTHTHTNSNTDTRAAHNHGGGKSDTVGGGASVWQSVGTGENPATDGHNHTISVDITAADSHAHTIGDTGSASSLPQNITRVFIQRMT